MAHKEHFDPLRKLPLVGLLARNVCCEECGQAVFDAEEEVRARGG